MVHNLLTDKSALLRVRGTSFFSYQTELLSDNIKKLEKDRKSGDIIGEILDNRRFVYLKTVAAGYLAHFDFNWLFLRGDISRHHAPFMGLLYLFELPFVLIGIYTLLFGNFRRQAKFLIFVWFLAAPIPASVTTGVPHAVRTLNFLPTLQIFSALGLITAIIFIANIKYEIANIRIKYLIFSLCFLFFIFNFLYYLNQYFVQQNYFYSQEWQYGYEEAVDTVKQIGDRYDKIVVSDSLPMDKSYMFFLFYLKYPPVEYQKIGAISSGSFISHHYFDKYEFRPIDWNIDSNKKNTLFVGPPFELPGAGLKKTIRNLDGKEAIRIVGI
jgi:hypothetical protein